MRLKALAGVLLLSWTAAASAQPAGTPSPFKFEFHGFASGTLWMQDGRGNQQGGYSEFAAAPQPQADKLSLGADVRQSRFNFSLTGPAVFGGAIPKGVMEIDWYGLSGAGSQGDIHLLPRLRLAYAELSFGGGAHRLQFGQQNDVSGAFSPYSFSKIGQSLHLAAGNFGFRHVGIFGYHTFGNVRDVNSNKVEFAWEIGRVQWINTGNGALNNGIGGAACQGLAAGTSLAAGGGIQALGTSANLGGAGFCTGEAANLPAVQARLSYMMGQNLTIFVAGSWARIDRGGVGQTELTGALYPYTTIDHVAGVGGLKFVTGPITFAGYGFYGKNTTPYTADFAGTQFTPVGDVHEFGAWGQLGFNLTKELSAWGFAGIEKDDYNDINYANTWSNANGLGTQMPVQRNLTYSAMLAYRDGGFGIGLEWIHYRTTYWVANGGASNVAAAGFNTNIMSMNSFLLTGIYFF